jgi:predicted negative regulator of RcsB-dependent stress response
MIRDARTTKAAGEITRKEMKGPDQFQVAATQLVEWAAARPKLLAGGAAGLVVVAAASIGVHAWATSSRDAAGTALYRALSSAEGEISSVPLPGLDRPIFKTTEERARAVIAAADKVRKDHPGSRPALTAALASGEAHLQLREWDAAAADFRAYLSTARPDDSLRFVAFDGVARAQEGKGEADAAAQSFESAGQAAPFFKDRAALDRARVLAAAGKLDEARKLLKAFPDENKDSSLKAEAQERLARLGEK